MSPLSLTKFASIGVMLSIFFAVGLGTSAHSTAPRATTIIDFESLSANGPIVRDQFTEKGIIFQPVFRRDYSQVPAIPNFAHSGTKAIELCFAKEFCREKLDISFTSPQRRVKLWAGFTDRLQDDEQVILRAYDASGNEVVLHVEVLGPSSGATPISIPLEVATPSASIVRVTAGFFGAELSQPTIFNNGLAFDDIEFDDPGGRPPCPTTQPPALTVNEPTDGAVIVHNAFTLDANLSTPDPFATIQIQVTGQQGGVRIFGPRFVASGPIRIFNITDLLFEGQNTFVFTAKSCAGATKVTRTIHFRRITRTSIRVVNENDANVQTARVYANGNFIGLTDAEGMLSISTPLAEGTKLVARKLVAESSTYRDNHSRGSFQDWKYRVYTSNMGVNSDGSLTAKPVSYHPDPNAPQVLRIMRRNTLIGLHVVVSILWDASTVEMEVIRQKMLNASKLLYNATDGQVFIEQVEVFDNARNWKDADFRVVADQSLTANARVGAFFDRKFFGSKEITVHRMSPAGVYAHEFGHYGFGLRDEHRGKAASAQCTVFFKGAAAGSVFGKDGAKAACLMADAGAPKLCSNHRENPHVRGTKQGASSCWTTLSEHYRDPNSSARWILRTPETRGEIPGTINNKNLPLDDMPPKVTVENSSYPNLCQPITVLATRSNGKPHAGREIRVATTYGYNILQGKTDQWGLLTLTGVHVGDRIEGRQVTHANCILAASLTPEQTRPQLAVAQDAEPLRSVPPAGAVGPLR